MIKIGLLSDTHGFFDPALRQFFGECQEIWHAGDIGNMLVIDEITSFKPLRAVYGNIDGYDIRKRYPEFQRFRCEEVDVFMTHIGGSPRRPYSRVKKNIGQDSPDLFISGHSHILKVMTDKVSGALYINPGAAGKTGFHLVRTAVRFIIDGNKIRDLEVIELGKR